MRIALVSTVSAPVLQASVGSVEAWVWLLSRELGKLGHRVAIFGCGGSQSEGEVVTTLPGPYGAAGSFDDWHLCEWVNLCKAVEASGRFDIVHAQAYLWGIPLERFARCPMLHTIHIVPDDSTARLWKAYPAARVSAISRQQWSAYPELCPAAVIPHGVDIAQFTFRPEKGDYLLYLGRFTSGKGPLKAIETARALGRRLILAGPENPYFREHIKPQVDGSLIQYAGYASPARRNELMGGAAALLYPIQYAEAFGLVLAEAMLCGTPVAAMSLGAVPELIEEGVTGFTTGNLLEFPAIAEKCLALDRTRVRQFAEQRFSAAEMALSYAALYENLIAGGAGK